MKKVLLTFLLLITLCAAAWTQDEGTEEKPKEKNAWISLGGEAAIYTSSMVSYGGGFSVGYGKGIGIGFKAVYFIDTEALTNILELGFLLRYYFFGSGYNSGPFVQLTAGQALFFRQDDITFPANWGMLCIGAAAGWQINLGSIIFIEPSIRAGYPYYIGGGLSVGIRF